MDADVELQMEVSVSLSMYNTESSMEILYKFN